MCVCRFSPFVMRRRWLTMACGRCEYLSVVVCVAFVNFAHVMSMHRRRRPFVWRSPHTHTHDTRAPDCYFRRRLTDAQIQTQWNQHVRHRHDTSCPISFRLRFETHITQMHVELMKPSTSRGSLSLRKTHTTHHHMLC